MEKFTPQVQKFLPKTRFKFMKNFKRSINHTIINLNSFLSDILTVLFQMDPLLKFVYQKNYGNRKP